MSLIDYTYFKGDLTIAGLDREANVQRLALFIDKYEDEFLRKLLGYPLYKAFINGLSQVSVEQRWLNILQGAEYQWNTRTEQWRGLIILPPGQSVNISPAGQEVLIAGGPGQFDPVAGQLTLDIPTSMQGVSFIIERRGTGQLTPSEFSIAGTVLTLVGMPAWNNGETIILSKGPSISLGVNSGPNKSPIANYVYWNYIKDQTTQTVSLGETASKSENASMVSPATKMVRAWNEMSEWLGELYRFMQMNYSSYPEWTFSDSCWNYFFRTNVYGI